MTAGIAAAVVLILLIALLMSASATVDRQRNDAVTRAVQIDQQLDSVRKSARIVKKASDDIRSGSDAISRAGQAGDAQTAGSKSASELQAGLTKMADATGAFRTASRALLESYAALGLYQGDIRAARTLATNDVGMLGDALWSYGQGHFADGDRTMVRAKLGLDNWTDATADLWRSALNRRNQPLDDARRFTKPFPLSIFDRAQLPPNRTDAPEQ